MSDLTTAFRSASFCLFLAVILGLGGWVGQTEAATRTVPGQFADIQTAIDSSAVGDTVLVADGTYTGSGNKNLDFGGKDIVLRSVNGAASTTIDCQSSGSAIALTGGETVAAVIEGFTLTGASTGAVFCDASSPTIRDCVVTGNSNAASGGGITLDGSAAVIERCVIQNNSTGDDGGGVASIGTGNNPQLSFCLITGNFATDDGGGVAARRDSMHLTSCTISGNEAGGDAGGVRSVSAAVMFEETILYFNCAGGAADRQEAYASAGGSSLNFYCSVVPLSGLSGTTTNTWTEQGDPLFVNPIACTSAPVAGGDYRVQSGSPALPARNNINCDEIRGALGTLGQILVPDDFSSIQPALDAATTGDTVLVAAGTYNFSPNNNLTFHGKDLVLLAESGPDSTILYGGLTGSALVLTSGETIAAEVRGFTFSGTDSGAIVLDNASLTLRECVISGNRTPFDGAGLSVTEGSVTIENCTVSGNEADGKAGGVFCGVNGSAVVIRSIIWGNCALSGSPGEYEALASAAGASLDFACSALDSSGIGGAVTYGLNNVYSDPLFCGPEACSGAPTQDGTYSVGDASPCLAANSPCGQLIGALGEACHTPTVIHVPGDYLLIQTAIDSAALGDTILVADGVYTGVGNRDLNFNGLDLVLMSQNGAASTIIDCEGVGDGISMISGEANAVVDGFTIQNAGDDGIVVSGASFPGPVIRNCTIQSSADVGVGSVIYLEVLNCTIERNRIGVSTSGGLVSGCTISGNLDYGVLGSRGSFVDCTITGNDTGVWSSVSPLSSGSIQFTGCTISGNTEGMYFSGTNLTATMTRTIVWGNCTKDVRLANNQPTVNFICSNVDTSNVNESFGDITYDANTIYADPLFCEYRTCESAPNPWGNYTLSTGSPCLATASPCGELIGAQGEACASPGFATATLHVPGEYPTIQDAVDNAFLGDTVLVASGTYSGVGNKSVTLEERGVLVRSVAGPDSTIIDCEGAGSAFRFVDAVDGVADAVQGFGVVNGGGFLAEDASPTIRNCRTAGPFYGVYLNGSSASVENCVLQGSVSYAVFVTTSLDSTNVHPSITGTLVSGNAHGIRSVSPTANLSLSTSTVAGNGTGFIIHASDTADVSQSVIWGNCSQNVTGGALTFSCSVIDTATVTGNVSYDPDNVFSDPLFCNPLGCGSAPAAGGEYGVAASSPCLPGNNTCGLLIGGQGQGTCLPTVLDVPGTYATIQAGLDAAGALDTVVVAAGTYTGPGNKNLDFGGKAVVLVSASGPAGTIIDCEGDGTGVIFDDGEGSLAEIRGFSIVNADSSGILCDNASPTIAKCVIAGNRALNGGGIWVADGNAQIQDCTISGNFADGIGGGLYVQGSSASATVTGTIIWGNCSASILGADQEATTGTGSTITIACSLVDKFGVGGFGTETYGADNTFGDPLFCAPVNCGDAPSNSGTYTLAAGSPALPANNTCGQQMGALGQGCSDPQNLAGGNLLRVPADYATIPQAAFQATNGDTILVAPGTYAGASHRNIALGGRGIVIRSETGAASTTIDCQGSGYGFYLGASDTNTAVIDGFTIKDPGSGGVQVFNGASPIIRNSIVTGNNSSSFPAIYVSYASAWIENCTLTQSTSTLGAGIRLFGGSTVTLSNCDISNNTAASQGGGVHVDGGATMTLIGCTISGNTAVGGAGGINNFGTCTVIDCLITGNQSNEGGGLRNFGTLQVTGSTVAGNLATEVGGGFHGDGPATFERTIFWYNCAEVGFSQIKVEADTLTFVCASIDSAGVGGAGSIVYDANTLHVDPEFCGFRPCGAAPTTLGTYTLSTTSPCLAANSPCGQQIGALGSGGCTNYGPGGFVLTVPSPYATLSAAVAAAIPGDTVLVQTSPLTGAGNKNVSFGGKDIVVRSSFTTQIDLQGSGRAFTLTDDETNLASIEGFWITNGDAGAIYCDGASVTIKDCFIAGNSNSGPGGGVFLGVPSKFGTQSRIIDCTIRSNSSSMNGGGIYTATGTPLISGCDIRGNTAVSGGGIHSTNSGMPVPTGPTLVACVITGNEATGNGGGFSSASSTTTIQKCTIASNSALSGGGIATGVFDSVAVIQSIVYNNCADAANYGKHEMDILGSVSFSCSNVDPFGILVYGIADFDSNTTYEDPLFCSPIPPNNCPLGASYAGTYTLKSTSPCLAANNSCGLLIGALDQGCVPGVTLVPGDQSTIQAALNSAGAGDTVRVAPGSYSGVLNRDLEFHGRAIVLVSEKGPDSTTINCSNLGGGFLLHDGEATNTVIDGFTIKNALVEGVRCTTASPTLRNLVIQDCAGGGVAFEASRSSMIDCEITGNGPTGRGGGVRLEGTSRVALSGCTITDNQATQGGGVEIRGLRPPGTVYNNVDEGTYLTVENCAIVGNDAGIGGGIYALTTELTLAGTVITGNTVGAVFLQSAEASITGCTIAGNSGGPSVPGGLFVSGADVRMERTIVWGNCDRNADIKVGASLELHCSNVDTSSFVGSGTVTYVCNNVFIDPLFCSPAACGSAPTTAGDYTVQDVSLAVAANSPCGQQIGALGPGCVVSVNTWTGLGDSTSWSDPANWTGGVPGGGSDVRIPDVAHTAEVVFSVMSPSVRTLVCDEPFRVAGDTLVVDSLAVFAGPFVLEPGGGVSGPGKIALNGVSTWSGGGMTGTGVTAVYDSLFITGGADKRLFGGRTLINASFVRWTGSGDLVHDHGNLGTRIHNIFCGTFVTARDGSLKVAAGGSVGLFQNDGVLIHDDPGALVLRMDFDNTDGTVKVLTGTLELTEAFANIMGTTLSGGTYDLAGTFAFVGADIETCAAIVTLDGPGGLIEDDQGGNGLLGFVRNNRKFTITGGKSLSTLSFVNMGTLTIGSGSTFTVNGSYTQIAGNTDVQAVTSTLSVSNNAIAIEAGAVRGSGTVGGFNAVFTNEGILQPGNSPGTLVIEGDFYNQPGAEIEIEVESPTVHDFVEVTGNATLSGVLRILPITDGFGNLFEPDLGDQFEVMTAETFQGGFTKVRGFSISVDTLFTEDPFGLDTLTTEVTNLHTRFLGGGDGVSWADSMNWSLGTPDASQDVFVTRRIDVDSVAVARDIRILSDIGASLEVEGGSLEASEVFVMTDPTTLVSGQFLIAENASVTLGSVELDTLASIDWRNGVVEIDGGRLTKRDGDLVVGKASGVSRLVLKNGATATIPGTIQIGGNNSSDMGEVAVLGPGSSLKAGKFLIGDVGTGTVEVSNGARIETTSGTVATPKVVVCEKGTLFGNGTIAGDLDNGGMVQPGGMGSAGTLRILGNYSQECNEPGVPITQGTLQIEVGDLNLAEFDRVEVGDNGGGAAILGGLLQVQLLPGYTPTYSPEIMTYSLVAGDFDSLDAPDLSFTWHTQATRVLLETAAGVVDAPNSALPRVYRLYPNAPNPFRSLTRITFDLPEPSPVKIQIFDISGRLVRTLVDGAPHEAGRFAIPWGGEDQFGRRAASGVYFYRLQAGTFRKTQRMVLIR